MDKKILLFDLDGTLLTSEKIISEDTKNSIIECQRKGHQVVLASGRPLSGILKSASELLMEEFNGLIIAYNGSMVYDLKNKKVLYETKLSLEDIDCILKHCEKFDITPMIDKNHQLFTSNLNGFNAVNEANGNNMELTYVENLRDFVDFPCHKILTSGEPSSLVPIFDDLAKPFIGKYNVMFTSLCYIEFTPINIDKGSALTILLNHLNANSSDCIAFGDGHNDYAMMKLAGTSVCMGNGVDACKEIATIVTDSNNNDGIAKALRQLNLV